MTIAEHGGSVTSTTSPEPTYPTGAKDVFISLPGSGGYVNLNITVFVAFNGGLSVVYTLETIEAEVANVLAFFKPDFGGRNLIH